MASVPLVVLKPPQGVRVALPCVLRLPGQWLPVPQGLHVPDVALKA